MMLSGRFLKFTRNMMHFRQQELADKMQIDRSLIVLMESGKRWPTKRTEEKFFSMLDAEGIGIPELTELYEKYMKLNGGKSYADKQNE